MKIGVVGNGKIVERFLADIREVPDLEVAGLCVRRESRAKGERLLENRGLAGAVPLVTDYEEFLKNPAMDAVYLGISNHVHYSYARQALMAGKHVVCEKPFTVKAWEAEELAALARGNRLFLWEAFKIAYSPLCTVIRRHLPEIGPVRMVQCNYSRVSSRYQEYMEGHIHPAFDPALAGGCLYDINLYNLHLVTGLFGRPNQVCGHFHRGYNGVEISDVIVLEYPEFLAVCSGAKDSTSPCGAVIQGERGYLRVEGPASSAESVWLWTGGEERLVGEDPRSGLLTDEMQEFVRQYEERDYSACYAMLDHSLAVMHVLEQAFAGLENP